MQPAAIASSYWFSFRFRLPAERLRLKTSLTSTVDKSNWCTIVCNEETCSYEKPRGWEPTSTELWLCHFASISENRAFGAKWVAEILQTFPKVGQMLPNVIVLTTYSKHRATPAPQFRIYQRLLWTGGNSSKSGFRPWIFDERRDAHVPRCHRSTQPRDAPQQRPDSRCAPQLPHRPIAMRPRDLPLSLVRQISEAL